MVINREKYYRWAWFLDLFISRELPLGGLSARREKLYATAYSFLGKDASPKDRAPDDLACAESVNAVTRAAFGIEVGGDLSTIKMYAALKVSKEFQETNSPLFGDIVISPTGMARVPVGHVGIVGKWQIMSNNSYTGLWDAHYTLESWRLRYGFTKFFRVIEPPAPPEVPPGVKEIVEKTVVVATEAAKHPSLHGSVMALLSAVFSFLSSLTKTIK